MKSLLIGCGVTGAAIAENIYFLPFISSLDLYSRSGKTALALEKRMKTSKVKAIHTINKNYDLIIVAISGISSSERYKSFNTRPSAYMVRQDELKYNLGGIIELTEILKNQRKARIIVITNPVDEITNFMNLRLGRKDLVGFGLELDAVRYRNLLSSQDLLCFGTHGKAFPILNDIVKRHYYSYYDISDERVMKFLRSSGMTSEITSQTFRQFLTTFYSSEKHVCQFTYFVNDSSLPSGLSYGLPWYVQNGKILGPYPVKLNKIERSILAEVIIQLKLSIKRLIAAEQKMLLYK